MIKCNIDPSRFEALDADRFMWQGTVKNSTMLFERKRCDEAISKRLIRKQNQSQVVPIHHRLTLHAHIVEKTAILASVLSVIYVNSRRVPNTRVIIASRWTTYIYI